MTTYKNYWMIIRLILGLILIMNVITDDEIQKIKNNQYSRKDDLHLYHHHHHHHHHSNQKVDNRYQPYGFGYEIEDGWGNTQYRHEKGIKPWDIIGSYGYKDAWGIFRHVDYVADKWGFRAHIKTNEPGTAPRDPAAVKIKSNPLPSGMKSFKSSKKGW